jgi:hypothetical protein
MHMHDDDDFMGNIEFDLSPSRRTLSIERSASLRKPTTRLAISTL